MRSQKIPFLPEQEQELKEHVLTVHAWDQLNHWQWGDFLIGFSSALQTHQNKFITVVLYQQEKKIRLPFWELYLILVKKKIGYPYHLEHI